jgi:hypothetical protein
MKFGGRKITNLTLLKHLPVVVSGYDDVRYEFLDRDLKVRFSYTFNDKKTSKIETLEFHFTIAIGIESENNNDVGLPSKSDVLFSFEADAMEGFNGYQIWFSNNDLVTVVCQYVTYNNEKF